MLRRRPLLEHRLHEDRHIAVGRAKPADNREAEVMLTPEINQDILTINQSEINEGSSYFVRIFLKNVLGNQT